jgi:RNA polymerase sigma-70 factor (ECF subfamily)
MRETDGYLLNLIKNKQSQGYLETFEVFIHKYELWIYTLAHRCFRIPEDAQDLAQEAVIKIYKKIGCVTLPENDDREDALKGWIYIVTANTCLDELRKRKRQPQIMWANDSSDEIAAVDPFNSIARAPSAEEIALARERIETLGATMAKLPEAIKTLIILREMNGLTYMELAESFGVPVNTIKSRLSRARKKKKKILYT